MRDLARHYWAAGWEYSRALGPPGVILTQPHPGASEAQTARAIIFEFGPECVRGARSSTLAPGQWRGEARVIAYASLGFKRVGVPGRSYPGGTCCSALSAQRGYQEHHVGLGDTRHRRSGQRFVAGD